MTDDSKATAPTKPVYVPLIMGCVVFLLGLGLFFGSLLYVFFDFQPLASNTLTGKARMEQDIKNFCAALEGLADRTMTKSLLSRAIAEDPAGKTLFDNPDLYEIHVTRTNSSGELEPIFSRRPPFPMKERRRLGRAVTLRAKPRLLVQKMVYLDATGSWERTFRYVADVHSARKKHLAFTVAVYTRYFEPDKKKK